MQNDSHSFGFEPPDLAPVIVCEHTATGWRGLTADGEVLNVNAHVNGSPADIPDSIAIARGGEIIGYRAVPKASYGVIDRYAQHLAAATALTRGNEHEQALEQVDLAIGCVPTVLARYNRSMILLALGRWPEGFDEFRDCEESSPLFMRPLYANAINRGIEPWHGQDISGKHLLLVSDHGHGDCIMALRFVPQLRAMGADVVLWAPPELARLATQIVPVTLDLVPADYVCSMLMLMQILRVTPDSIQPTVYLKPDPELVAQWKQRIGGGKIGVAWSVGQPHDDDYPREVPPELLCRTLDRPLVSVQQQGGAEANRLGIAHFDFKNFADCAAAMAALDEIVTVDTAAAHLAGAIGHPRITLLLSHWASWRWQAPLYANLLICRQDVSGDWDSALAKHIS